MYEFWYDYLKPKYGENTKLCYTDTDSFIVHLNVQCSQLHVKTENVIKILQKMLKQDLTLNPKLGVDFLGVPFEVRGGGKIPPV